MNIHSNSPHQSSPVETNHASQSENAQSPSNSKARASNS